MIRVVGDGRRAFGFLHVVMVCLGLDRCALPPLIAFVAARPPSRPSLPPSQPPGLKRPPLRLGDRVGVNRRAVWPCAARPGALRAIPEPGISRAHSTSRLPSWDFAEDASSVSRPPVLARKSSARLLPAGRLEAGPLVRLLGKPCFGGAYPPLCDLPNGRWRWEDAFASAPPKVLRTGPEPPALSGPRGTGYPIGA